MVFAVIIVQRNSTQIQISINPTYTQGNNLYILEGTNKQTVVA